jgi:hypothetical protein
MSFEQINSTAFEHSSRASSLNEMQREDFLALAAALRAFNAYQPQVSMAIANAQYAGEYPAGLTAE